MSLAKQTAELVARLKKEGRVITDKAHIAEIRARCEAHDVEPPEHLLQHPNTKDVPEGVGAVPATH